MSTPEQPRRPRHLMDPANPQRQVNDASLSRVQRWVMSALAVTTVVHLAAGIIIASLYVPREDVVARVGLNVIAAILCVLGIALAFVIHQKRPINAWLLLGLLPGMLGVWLALR